MSHSNRPSSEGMAASEKMAPSTPSAGSISDQEKLADTGQGPIPVSTTAPVPAAAADISPPPDGGLRAWLVVAGGFLAYFATFGLLNSYGTFQALYIEKMLTDKSETTISWIGSVQVFLLFIGGMFFGPIFDLYGSKVLFFPGTILYVLSMMFTSLSTKYYQLLLAQGFLYGIADAMIFYPTISSITHWFQRRHGLAIGIVVSGSSIGGICWPIAIERLFNTVGFPWACRIVGFICLAILAGPCFMVAPRIKPGTGPKAEIGAKEFKELFSDKRFLLLTAGMFFVFWGMFNPFYNLPIYGIRHGMSLTMANYSLAILNAGSFFGRIGSGIMADKLGRFYVTAGCAFLSGLLCLCLHAIKTPAGIIAYAALFGATSGGLISLQSSCVAEITTRMDLIGVNIGVMMAICSLAALTGNPISTALMATGSFSGFINFSGITLLVGSALVLFSKIVGRGMPTNIGH